MPVSYTHLDVYKRQNLSHELLRQQCQWTEAESLVKNQVRDLLQKVDAALSLDTPTSV